MSNSEGPVFPGGESLVPNGARAIEADARSDRVLDVHESHSGGVPPKGSELLNQVHRFLGRFIAYPCEEAHVAHTLWIAHTHLMAAWETTPRLAFLSPEPSSGKTRALEVTALLVPRAVQAVNASHSYLFRRVAAEAGRPTVLYDEIDAVFGPKSKPNEDIRAFLNAGYRKGAKIGRCAPNNGNFDPQEMAAYCAVALAGLGSLPDTILTRSIAVRMRKRGPREKVEGFRVRDVEPEGELLQEGLAAWAGVIESQVQQARPEMPAGVEDRDADIWEPLLAVADAAGGPWPEVARATCVSLVTQSKRSSPSLGVRLLADVYDLMIDRKSIATEELVDSLLRREESPWDSVAGKTLDARYLAKFLGTYEISPKVLRISGRTVRGYERHQFQDAWTRYLARG